MAGNTKPFSLLEPEVIITVNEEVRILIGVFFFFCWCDYMCGIYTKPYTIVFIGIVCPICQEHG